MLELYNLKEDFSQTTDLAAKYPKKVKEMKKMFIAEAKKFQVFPMDASVAAETRRNSRAGVQPAFDRCCSRREGRGQCPFLPDPSMTSALPFS